MKHNISIQELRIFLTNVIDDPNYKVGCCMDEIAERALKSLDAGNFFDDIPVLERSEIVTINKELSDDDFLLIVTNIIAHTLKNVYYKDFVGHPHLDSTENRIHVPALYDLCHQRLKDNQDRH